MGQRKGSSSGRRTGEANSNRNVRSISNSREVSRRSKGKNRYAYEDEGRASARYYEQDEFYRSEPKRKKKSKQYRDEEMQNSKRKNSTKGRKGDRDRTKKPRRRGRRKKSISKILGIILTIIQFILSVILVVNVMFFNMLTSTYVMVLAGVLLILLCITLLSQLCAKKKGIPGKIFCIFMCIVLGAGSFYISKINNAFQKVTGSNTQTSSVVVAVKADDKAEKIQDAAEYKFGVQYTTNGDQIRSAVSEVTKETGVEIETVEYNSLMDEVQALYDGEIDAIIYNAGQTGVVKEHIPTFDEDVRVIYKHRIVIEIENEAVDASMSEPFAVYLSGMDTYEPVTEADRSDVNIIAVVNPKSHQVLLVSTPRDYWVPIPGISGGQNDKLTHAGIYGVEASMTTLSELYEVELPFFGRVNFTTMIKIVDELGGLDVESDEAFTTSSDSEYVMDVQLGMNHFDGAQTLAFCRERQNLADGDNARGRHQQAVITAIIKKMMSPAMLRGATGIIESVSDGVDTNFTTEQIQSLIKTQLRSNASWNIYSVSAEGYGSQDVCYSSGSTPLYVTVPDDTSVANIIDLINRVEAGEVLEGSVSTE